jgi:hypothetical protein
MRYKARPLNFFYHEYSGDKKLRLYGMRGGRGVRAKVEAAANATLARLSARFT